MAPEPPEALRLGFAELGKRAAALGGALVALVSLWSKAPVDNACLRGGLVYLAVRLTTRWGAAALGRAAALELSTPPERDSG